MHDDPFRDDFVPIRSAPPSHVPYWHGHEEPPLAPSPHTNTVVAISMAPSYQDGDAYLADDGEERAYRTLIVIAKAIIVTALILLLLGCIYDVMLKKSESTGVTLPIQHAQRRTPLHEIPSTHEYDPEEDHLWFDDQVDWIDDGETLVRGMWSFYSKTGVRPYLIIADNIDGMRDDFDSDAVESYMRSRYDELFDDDDSLILLFFEPYDDYHESYLLIGENASKVIDSSMERSLYMALDRWYTDDSLDDNQYFALVFTASADAIMNGTLLSEYDGTVP